MKEELKKLGLRVRPRIVAKGDSQSATAFDDRADEKFEWANEQLSDDSATGEYPTLAIADEEPPADTAIRANPKGLQLGYNPYESGLLAKKEFKPKRDLRELSRWIDMKRKLDSGEK